MGGLVILVYLLPIVAVIVAISALLRMAKALEGIADSLKRSEPLSQQERQ